MNATKRGALMGAFIGVIAAGMNWDGNIIAASASIMLGSVIGYLIGRRFDARNPK